MAAMFVFFLDAIGVDIAEDASFGDVVNAYYELKPAHVWTQPLLDRTWALFQREQASCPDRLSPAYWLKRFRAVILQPERRFKPKRFAQALRPRRLLRVDYKADGTHTVHVDVPPN